jgi:hypothetical protein
VLTYSQIHIICHSICSLQAVSNTTGTVSFSAGCSSELCSIQSSGAGDSVAATTVDDFVASLPGSSSRSFLLDILKIDTEGAPAHDRGSGTIRTQKGCTGGDEQMNCSQSWINSLTAALGDHIGACVVAGFDPAVLQGARKLLAAKKAAILYFEYKCVLFFESCSSSILFFEYKCVLFECSVWNLWATTALKDVVAQLEALDYNCYFEGRCLCRWSVQPFRDPFGTHCKSAIRPELRDTQHLPSKQPAVLIGNRSRVQADAKDFVWPHAGRPTYTRITGCWDDAYEFKGWSNVVCATTGHFMHAVLERLSFRAHF